MNPFSYESFRRLPYATKFGLAMFGMVTALGLAFAGPVVLRALERDQRNDRMVQALARPSELREARDQIDRIASLMAFQRKMAEQFPTPDSVSFRAMKESPDDRWYCGEVNAHTNAGEDTGFIPFHGRKDGSDLAMLAPDTEKFRFSNYAFMQDHTKICGTR